MFFDETAEECTIKSKFELAGKRVKEFILCSGFSKQTDN